MRPHPKTVWNPARFDARAFAEAGGQLNEVSLLSSLPRLQEEVHEGVEATQPQQISWQASGELRATSSNGPAAVWMHLSARTTLPLTCQRCLGPVETAVEVDRWFRFVADEAVAAAEDEDCEEDLLALEPRPNLMELLEDELLMALPLVPVHEACPVSVPMQAGDPAVTVAEEETSERKNPFAALSVLKK